ncbi:hypothetical protein CU633_06545 [Bacillus sp. V3-13]|uniref:hypothetical protein n=1 Tax=Bacillus sp. V3-13 TaxID=2053728 RepID=UPI000C77386D|nr:hypothetical protein [Bacillus sp. V3-13]PLR78173.1 hypothetical protein CU633_06545 [Bacillus sp. V3-13]
MFSKRVWRWILLFSVALVCSALAGVYWYYYLAKDQPVTENVANDRRVVEMAVSPEPQTDAEGDQPQVTEERFTSNGQFIAYFHNVYNESLGWGGADSINWDKQRQYAQAILNGLSYMEIEEELQADFQKIKELAELVVNRNEKARTAILLHRLFHDLDIDFNKYKHSDYFNTTEYKNGKEAAKIDDYIEAEQT